MESFFVKSGQRIQLPTNNFTPPEDKEYYTCTAYDTDPNGYSRYRAGGFYTFNDNTLLYAFRTPPTDPSIGGASEKYKGQTVWSQGVNIKEEDWKKTSDVLDEYFAEWKSGCGRYDVSQGTFNFCWAATAGNAIHWWLDRNAAYIDRYFELNNTEKPDFSYPGQGKSNVFSLFPTHWRENKGGFANIGFNRFVNENDNDAIQSSARGQAGYFKDVFGSVLLSETSSSMNRRSFNTFIAKALENGKLITMGERNMSGGHAFTCWEFDFDEEGYICALYYTDSATDWNNASKNKDLSLGKITVKYDENRKPYMETKNLIYGEVQYGRIDIVDIQSYSQGTEYWEAYFASRPGN